MRPSRKASHSECRARAGDGDYKLIFHFLRDLSNLTKTHASQVSARVSKDTIHLFPSRFSSISAKLNYSLGELIFCSPPENIQTHNRIGRNSGARVRSAAFSNFTLGEKNAGGRQLGRQAPPAGREHCFFCPFRRRYTGAYVSESNLHVRTQVMCNAIFVCRDFADIDFIHCSGNETKELEISTQSVATTQGQQRARCGFSSIHLFLRKRLSSRLHTPLFDANERRPSANSRQINARAAIYYAFY